MGYVTFSTSAISLLMSTIIVLSMSVWTRNLKTIASIDLVFVHEK